MDLSVIVPVYNTDQKKITRCFESIKKLCDFRVENEIECVIVDDGSVASIGKFCSEFAKKNENFVYFRKDNGGVSSARNLGINKAQGNYICFVDSDDVVEIEGFSGSFFSMECDLLFTDLVVQRAKRTETWKAFDKLEGKIDVLDVLRKISNDGKLNGPVCKRIKQKFLEENDICFRQDLVSGEDAVFLMDMLSCNPSMYYISVVGYRYFLESDSSKKRLLGNVKLVFNNNRVLYSTIIELIDQNAKAGRIDHANATYLISKSTERYIKQIFNIAAALSKNNCLTEDKKRLILDLMLLVEGADHFVIGMQSKFQYRTVIEGRWKMVWIYSFIRELYLKLRVM